MIHADAVNGGFETLAGVMVLNHCRVLLAQRSVRGVSVTSCVFFTLWGLWNLIYYPSLGQSMSWVGGMFVVAANVVYVGLLVHFRRKGMQ